MGRQVLPRQREWYDAGGTRLLLRLLPGQHLPGSYAQTRLGYSRGSILFDSVLGGRCASCSPRFLPLFATNSGRRRVLLAGSTLVAVGHAADRLRHLVCSRWLSSACMPSADRFRTHGIVHPRNCNAAAADTRAARSRRISLGLPAALLPPASNALVATWRWASVSCWPSRADQPGMHIRLPETAGSALVSRWLACRSR